MHSKFGTKARGTFERNHKAVTVRENDTLSSIALRETGRADAWVDIYAVGVNRATIHAAQRAHGAHDEGAHLIYPDTVLWIPRRLLREAA